jgi:hypothetical protein
LRIVDWVANTTWVAKGYGNITNSPNGPYYTVLAGVNAARLGGRVLVIPGGAYPENFTTNKPLSIATYGGITLIGQ